jgi:hypothetical protein
MAEVAEVAERDGGKKQKSVEPMPGLSLVPSCCTLFLSVDGGSGGKVWRKWQIL